MGMTIEELIEKLRVSGKYDPDQALAADRIEQLVAANEQLVKERGEAESNETLCSNTAVNYLERAEAAEYKLTVALRALEFISCEDNAEGRHARAILDELEK